MKRVIYIFTFILLSLSIQAQDLNKLIKDFSKRPNAESVHFRKFLFSIMKIMPVGKDASQAMKKISSIQVVDLSDCSPPDKESFARSVSNIKEKDYDLLLQAKDDEDNVLIYSKTKKRKIRELVVINCDSKEPAIIRLKGKFSLDDLPGIKKEYGGKKKNKI